MPEDLKHGHLAQRQVHNKRAGIATGFGLPRGLTNVELLDIVDHRFVRLTPQIAR